MKRKHEIGFLIKKDEYGNLGWKLWENEKNDEEIKIGIFEICGILDFIKQHLLTPQCEKLKNIVKQEKEKENEEKT